MNLEQGQQFNPAAFTLHNKIVNENGIPLTFKRHKFLIKPYMDLTPRQVSKKCGQIGFSTMAIIKSFHAARYFRANVIYTLPSKPIIKDFVTPKVNPLIASNNVFRDMVGDTDSLGLKSVGKGSDARFIYFRSSWDEASGISISAHILVNDELDRSNQKSIKTYKTRLDAAKLDRPELGWWWKFSNPTIPGYGVDEDWAISDQKHWLIKCHRCNHYQDMTWPDSIDIEKKIYICKKCRRHLTDENRSDGRWVQKLLGRDVSGYWFTQMMAPWITADKIIEDSEGDLSIFHNFTLGEPYQPKDHSVTRESIMQCLSPDQNPQTNVAIGVDNGIIKHYVIGNEYGIFKIGTTKSWQDIENLRNRYNAVMVIDANPYPATPKKLVQKYPGKMFMHYYEEDKKKLGITRWGQRQEDRGVVKSDRTKVIDAVVADIAAQDILFNVSLTELENESYINHWTIMFRAIEKNEKGMERAVWITKEGKDDHYAHATVLQRVAQTKAMSGGQVITTPTRQKKPDMIIVNPDNTTSIPPVTLDTIKEQVAHKKQTGWQYR